jgi:O-glycosyl hydrolase
MWSLSGKGSRSPGISPPPRSCRWLLSGLFGSLTLLAMAVVLPVRTASGQGSPNVITVATATKFQNIEGWGTSLAGWTSTNYQDANFRAAYVGAGCNLLRLNIDQRSVDQSCGGTVPTFSGNVSSDANLLNFNYARLIPYTTFAQWLVANALEPTRVKIEGSVWTPPHRMKGATGCRSGGKPMPRCATFGGDSIGGRLIQNNDGTLQANRQQFAYWFAAWLYKWKQVTGAPISYASIQNELSFENPFDSCTYRYAPGCVDGWWQYARALRAVQNVLSTNGQLGETQLMGPHEAHIGDTDTNPWGLLNTTMYLQSLSDIDPQLYSSLNIINNNGYITGQSGGARCWDAQVRGIDNVPGGWPAWFFPPLMHTGLGTAKTYWASEADGVDPAAAMEYGVRMQNALVFGRVSAYVSWQMSDGTANETNNILLGTSHWANPHASKKYCNFKHFARYIRPGAQRVAATFSNGKPVTLGANDWDSNAGLSVSAYQHATDGRTTVVVINRTAAAQAVTINGLPGTSYQVFQTKGTDTVGFNQLASLPVSGGSVSTTLPAGSITTLTTP